MRCGKKITAVGVRGRLTRLFRRLAGCQDGAAAIEFAIVGVPFIAILVAILETSMVFFTQQLLQTATTQTARLIMTGQAQNQGMSATQFKQAVCTNAISIFDCTNLYVNVQKFSSFSGMTQPNPVSNGVFNASSMTYITGGPGDIILIQVFYKLPMWDAPLGFDLSNLSAGQRLLVATSVFRNEPYK
jgi:Flp pilus assembly protein TadG